ncbi:unnamed protein product [Trichogramma brassicae]|uniref:Uncharacterized protein n=1 Tax=Trichogramma brassicae TaxID=86971 RepID=A0A6H5I6K3_9HYME|nr:unnamed protein product [Trichogramma brassicae]
MDYGYEEVIGLLLERGADPNAANKYGETPLHSDCWKHEDHGIVSAKTLFEICDEKHRPLRLDAQTYGLGSTPLLLALDRGNKGMAETLLRRGANPNLASYQGLAPLHVICDKEYPSGALAKMFFRICDEIERKVEIDAKDVLDRTPLQLAVKNLCPDTVDMLFNRGADLSSFVFLFSEYFDEEHEMEYYGKKCKLRIASRALAVVELLEKKGYTLDRSDAMITMRFFDRQNLFQKSADIGERWYNDEEFAKEAIKITLKDDNQSLSLYELIRLRPKEVAKQLAHADYSELAEKSFKLPEKIHGACLKQLLEKLSRRFFRRWALDCFLEVTRYRLPVLCCEAILENLMNQDLYRVCLATTRQSRTDSEKNRRVRFRGMRSRESVEIEELTSVKFEVTGERLELLRQIHSLIADWKGPLPDFRDIFRPEEIDLLLSDDFEFGNRQKFIRFVARSGYEDTEVREPSSSSRRTTAVHRFSRLTWTNEMMPELFQIYDRFDANYVDDIGLSHLHVASMFGCDDIVEKFLKHGQDPNCVEREKGETPLHLALRLNCHDVAELLLLHGADINLANKEGRTPLHVNCSRTVDYGFTEVLFEIMDDTQQQVQVDARDKEGNTPGLRVAVHGLWLQGGSQIAARKRRRSELDRRVWIDSSARHLPEERRGRLLGQVVHRVQRRNAADSTDRRARQAGLDTAALGSQMRSEEGVRGAAQKRCRSKFG